MVFVAERGTAKHGLGKLNVVGLQLGVVQKFNVVRTSWMVTVQARTVEGAKPKTA